MPKKKKKERSKQRRPPTNGGHDGSRGDHGDACPRPLTYKLVHGLPPSEVVEAIRSGDGAVTRGTMFAQTNSQDEETKYRQRLNDAGLADALLEFLRGCERPVDGSRLTAPEYAQRILSPYQWVNLLNYATIDMDNDNEEGVQKVRVHVAMNIWSLIGCMCRGERVLFGSKFQWHWSLDGFVRLIGNCSQNRDAAKILAGHEGLVRMLVQLVFVQSHRPDIVKEAEELRRKARGSFGADYTEETFPRAAVNAERILRVFIENHQHTDSGRIQFDEADRSFLASVAATPVLRSLADGTTISEAPFVLEMMSLFKTRTSREGRRFPLFCLSILSAAVKESAVSAELVRGAVDFGARVADCFEEAMAITSIVFLMLQPTTGTFTRVSDHRMAAAIRSGLLEMCLKFAVLYGSRPDPHPEKEDQMATKLWHLVNSCHVIALHKQSSRAIAMKRSETQNALAQLGVDCQKVYGEGNDQFDERSNVTNTFIIGWKHSYPEDNDARRCVVQAVQSTLRVSLTNCCNCLKLIEGGAIKRCNSCKRSVYCSRECQMKHWKSGGHKLDCKRLGSVKDSTIMGAGKKDIAKARDLESNIIVACNKLFVENIPRILQQAKYLDCSILDCVVSIGLNHQLPFVKLFVADDDVLAKYGIEQDHFDRNRSAGAVTCAYSSYVFNAGDFAAEKSSGGDCGHSWPITHLFQTFPASLAPHGSWKVAQEKVEGHISNDQRYFGGPSVEDFSAVDKTMEKIDQALKGLQDQFPDIDVSRVRAEVREGIIQGGSPQDEIMKSWSRAVEEMTVRKMMANMFQDS